MAGVLAYFTPDASAGASFGAASSAVALPGTLANDTLVMVTNVGSLPVAVKLGGSTVTVTTTTGLVILAGQSVALGIGSNTYIAGAAVGAIQGLGLSQCAVINLTTGI